MKSRQRGIIPLIVAGIIAAGVALAGLAASIIVVTQGKARTQLETTVVDCAQQEIDRVAQGSLKQVENLLSGGDPNWEQELVALETASGDGVLCAVAGVLAQLKTDLAQDNASMSSAQMITAAKAVSFLTDNPKSAENVTPRK